MAKSCCMVLGTLFLLVNGVNSQAPQARPFKRPAFSPYLNLTRPGGNPALNYFGLVRPEINAFNALQQLQTNQTALALQQQEMALTGTGPLPTGHVTGFLTHQKYFMTRGGATVARSAVTSQPRQVTPSKGRTR